MNFHNQSLFFLRDMDDFIRPIDVPKGYVFQNPVTYFLQDMRVKIVRVTAFSSIQMVESIQYYRHGLLKCYSNKNCHLE